MADSSQLFSVKVRTELSSTVRGLVYMIGTGSGPELV